MILTLGRDTNSVFVASVSAKFFGLGLMAPN
jgi:hypothetical protein